MSGYAVPFLAPTGSDPQQETTMEIHEKLIDEIVRRIVSAAAPDRIILYGSAATGEMSRESDIDLLVLEQAPQSAWEESRRIREALQGLAYPFDVLVMDTQRFEETKDVIGGMAFAPNKYGRVIYTKPEPRMVKKPEGEPCAVSRRPREEVKRELLEQWIAKAERNLDTAQHFLSEALPYPDLIGLHARFAAEQYLKAFLVQHQIEFTKINDLGELVERVATVDTALARHLRDVAALNVYDVDVCYPSEAPEATREAVEEAVALAAKARELIRSALELD